MVERLRVPDEIIGVKDFGKEHLNAIHLVCTFGAYVVMPGSGITQEMVEKLDKEVSRIGLKATRLPTWRLDDGSPLAGVERVRFERRDP